MKKNVLFILILCLCFTAFGTASAEEAAESGIVLNDGMPWVDYSLRENIALVEQKPDSPKDNFYLWANYDWLRSAEIQPGSFQTNTFSAAEAEITEKCLELLTDTTLKSEDAALVQYLYNAFLDWDARNAVGIKPLQEIIDRISAVSTLDELTRLLSSEDYWGSKLFRSDVVLSFNTPGVWITDVRPKHLLLEDSAEYRERTETGKLQEKAYTIIISKVLERLGYTSEEASEIITRTFALETELADSIMTRAEQFAPEYYQRINNEMSRAEAETICDTFPWLEIMDGNGYAGAQRYLVEEPAYLQKMDGIYREDRLEDLKSCLIAKTVMNNITYLDAECYDLSDELYTIFGVEGSTQDEKEACQAVRSLLPSQMARAFFEKYDPTKMKEDITRLCEKVIGFYRKMISGEDWLTEETRAKAIEKLDKMRIMAVSPEKWPDYSELSFEGLGYFDCMLEIARVERVFIRSLVDQPADPDLWYLTRDDTYFNDVLLNNAAYGPEINKIAILRGILGSDLYREDMSDEELYGAIGSIIAHEISHAFDPTCSQFDADGRLNNWWTEEDHAAFDVRAKKVIDYFNGITVFSGLQVQGESVQGEAIADMGSVKCLLSLLEEKKENVDYRAFFEAVAKTWRELITWESEYYFLMQDPHPQSYLRVNAVLQQFPQFHETYGIKEGDGMWLKPEDRVPVW